MSRKSQRNQAATEPAASAAPATNPGRRNILIATGVATVAALGVGVALFRRSGASTAEDAALAQRPGLPSPHAPTLGEATAKVQIVEFLDPACETCAVFYPIIKQVMAEHPGRIRLSLRHVPLHQGADYVVALLEASRNQNRYWQILEALFKNQDRWVLRHVVQPKLALEVIADVDLNWDQLALDMSSPEVRQRMAQDRGDATLLGVKQTPEYFVNGRQMETFGRQQLLDLVNRALRRAYG